MEDEAETPMLTAEEMRENQRKTVDPDSLPPAPDDEELMLMEPETPCTENPSSAVSGATCSDHSFIRVGSQTKPQPPKTTCTI